MVIHSQWRLSPIRALVSTLGNHKYIFLKSEVSRFIHPQIERTACILKVTRQMDARRRSPGHPEVVARDPSRRSK